MLLLQVIFIRESLYLLWDFCVFFISKQKNKEETKFSHPEIPERMPLTPLGKKKTIARFGPCNKENRCTLKFLNPQIFFPGHLLFTREQIDGDTNWYAQVAIFSTISLVWFHSLNHWRVMPVVLNKFDSSGWSWKSKQDVLKLKGKVSFQEWT